VASEISDWPLSALLTVATETPHSCARSFRDDISSSSSQEPIGSERILNRFRNFNIAHFAPKIKRKRKSFVSIAMILAVCSIFGESNYAVCSIFALFRSFSNIFSLPAFVSVGTFWQDLIITLEWGFSFPVWSLWAGSRRRSASPAPPASHEKSSFSLQNHYKILTISPRSASCPVRCIFHKTT
jgi:hypothetical protein